MYRDLFLTCYSSRPFSASFFWLYRNSVRLSSNFPIRCIPMSSERPEKLEISDDSDRTSVSTRHSAHTDHANNMPRRSLSRHHISNTPHRTQSRASRASTQPPFDIDLPYRTLSGLADLNEYVTEYPSAEIDLPGRQTPQAHDDYKLVTFVPHDPENPKNWSRKYKWYCTMVVSFTCFVVAFSSAVVTSDIIGVSEEFNVSQEVGLLTVTLFVLGFGIGMEISLQTWYWFQMTQTSNNHSPQDPCSFPHFPKSGVGDVSTPLPFS